MMQETVTLNVNNQKPIVYRLQLNNPKKETNPEKIIGDLMIIFDNYKGWNDLVSLKIKEWGERVFTISPDIDITDPESLLNKVESDVNQLYNKVLISSFFSPLTDPLLDGKYTWERNELEVYCKKYANFGCFSPIDGKKIEIQKIGEDYKFPKMKEHLFAIDIIKWANNTPFQPTEVAPFKILTIQNNVIPKEEQNAIVKFVPVETIIDPNKALGQLQVYKQVGKITRDQYYNYESVAIIKKATEELKLSTAEIEEYVRLSIERAKRHAENQKEEVLEALSQMKASHQGSVDILNARLDDHKHEIKITFQKLTYSEQKCLLHEARIEQLTYLYNDALNQAREARDKANSSGGRFCVIS